MRQGASFNANFVVQVIPLYTIYTVEFVVTLKTWRFALLALIVGCFVVKYWAIFYTLRVQKVKIYAFQTRS